MRMHPTLTCLVLAAILVPLAGCAPVVVGGAAATGIVLQDRRTAGTIIDDEAVELKAAARIAKDPELHNGHVSVTSFNGIVLLSGQAPTEEAKARATEIVRRIPKVRRVYNELAVAAPNSMMVRTSDTLLTAKVKTRLFKVKGPGLEKFSPLRVKVVTENGTVYLMGLVRHREADAATEAARRIKGVQRVVRLFEYLD